MCSLGTQGQNRRFAGAERISPLPRSYEGAEFERARPALEISKEIRAWLGRERIDGDDRKQIVQQAREFLDIPEENETSPRQPPVGTTAEEPWRTASRLRQNQKKK